MSVNLSRPSTEKKNLKIAHLKDMGLMSVNLSRPSTELYFGPWLSWLLVRVGRCSKLSSLSSLVRTLDRRGKYEINYSAHW